MLRFKTTAGDFTVELFSKEAPESSANFLKYVDDGHYDGTLFHRVIPNFMIQGGGFTADMKQKPSGAEIRNEANNGLKNNHYTIAMARTSDPHSATAQFFINVADNDFLNHTAPSASRHIPSGMRPSVEAHTRRSDNEPSALIVKAANLNPSVSATMSVCPSGVITDPLGKHKSLAATRVFPCGEIHARLANFGLANTSSMGRVATSSSKFKPKLPTYARP